MPAVVRELTITYGATSVGGATDRVIDGPLALAMGYEQAVLSFEIATTNFADEAAFRAEITVLEAAFSTPRQRLQIIGATGTYLDLDPATNSGFDAVASIDKIGSPDDTARSRRYRIAITVALPADLAGQAGRTIDSSFTVDFSASDRRTLTIEGSYTALGANQSRAQYAAAIAAHVATVQGALGGNWDEKVSESITVNDSDKRTRFRRSFNEILLNQAAGVINDADLVDPKLDVRRGRSAPGETPLFGQTVERLVTYRASYASAVRTATGLREKWENVIRPWIIQHVREATGASGLAVVDEDPGFDATERTITASMTLLAAGGTRVLQASVSVEDADDPGRVLVPAWTGDPHAKFEFLGPATFTRTVTTSILVLGLAPLATPPRARGGGGFAQLATVGVGNIGGFAQLQFVGAGSISGAAGSWRSVGPQRSRQTPRRLGLPGDTLDVTEVVTTRTFVWSIPAGRSRVETREAEAL